LLEKYRENALDEIDSTHFSYLTTHEKEYIQILEVEESYQKRKNQLLNIHN
jgi:hypothetical protein